MKTAGPTPSDEIREEILRFLYEVHVNRSGSDYGRTTGDAIVQEVRKRTGANRREIARHSDYLRGAGYIEFSTKEIVNPPRGGSPTSVQRHYYNITVPGIARFEKVTKFEPTTEAKKAWYERPLGRIAIAVASGVVTAAAINLFMPK